MTIADVRQAAKIAGLLVLGFLALILIMHGMFWFGVAIYDIAGRVGVIAELLILLFFILFLGALFSEHAFNRK